MKSDISLVDSFKESAKARAATDDGPAFENDEQNSGAEAEKEIGLSKFLLDRGAVRREDISIGTRFQA